MATWLWLILWCTVLLCVYTAWWGRRARRLLAGLPGYPQIPLLGNLLQLAGDGRSLFRLLEDMSRKSDDAMKPFQIWFGPFPNIVISDPDDLKTVCNSFIEKPYYYNFGRVWLGDGLVTAPGFLWKQNIKRLANTFNTSVVDSYQEVFSTQAMKLVENLKKLVGKEPMDIMHLLAYTTLETICQTALGTARISDSVVTQEYYEAFNQCLMLLIRRGLNPLQHPEWLYRLTSGYKDMMQNLAVVHNVSNTVLTKKKLERELMKRNNCNGPEASFKAVLDILLDLAESDPQLTEEQVRHEVDTIIVGGQETTATTMFYALLMLGSHPAVQDELAREIFSVFGESRRPVEKGDLGRLQYCEAVILETLRLFPPLPAVMRYADRELQLKSCRVPKGTGCALNIWGAGRSAHSWGADAARFRPERWTERRAARPAPAFIPFSYGRRACIGKKYAMAILKTVLASCVRELQFSSDTEQLELKADIALRPVAGHLMTIEIRN